MAVQKNFVVKNGIEVNTKLIFADAGSNKVGIATTNPKYTLHVTGGIGATHSTVTGVSTVNNLTINGRITAGSSLGSVGQYLVSTGAGVTWTTIPALRSIDTQTATVGVTTFSTTYVVGLLDVYVNGVRLSEDEFIANDSVTVTLDDACFGGETVEFVSFSPFAVGVADTSTVGLTVLEEGVPIGSPLQVTSINFVGTSVTAVGAGYGVTVYVSDYVSSSGIATYATTAGIATYSSTAGIATYATTAGIATYSSTAGIASYTDVAGVSTVSQGLTGTPNIEVGIITATNAIIGAATTQLIINGDARITGVLAIGTSTISLDGSLNTITVGSGVTIDGSTGTINANSFVGDGSGLIGVVGSGSGVIILDDGSVVGTAATIDFGENLSVSPISAGIVTVTVVGYATEGYVNNALVGVLTTGDLVGYTTEGYVDNALVGFVTSGALLDYATQEYVDNSVVGFITSGALIGYANWTSTTAGIHTLSSVGIGTTNPTSALTVKGLSTLEDITISGVTTSQGGFTSGIGVTNPVQITVSDNILTFNVVGVGSTSLILY